MPAAAATEYQLLPDEPDEPILEDDDIQGNGLAGFNKDHQAFLYFEISDVAKARTWLARLVDDISTLREVATFNRRFRDARGDDAADPPGLSATWTNIAFTASGLERLRGAAELQAFADIAFRDGAAARARLIGDTPGSERGWVVGKPGESLHGVLIVASDDCNALGAKIRHLQEHLAGVRITFSDFGQSRTERRGHEHFGFRDGISQPAVRGRLASSPAEYLTPRYLRGAEGAHFATAGRPLIWPGQFVFGLPTQAPDDPLRPVPPANDVPAWAQRGSYLVIRRLEQDVVGFWEFLRKEGAAHGIPAERVGALLVGRWPSGCPVTRSPQEDDAASAQWGVDNHFGYANAAPATRLAGDGWQQQLPGAPADPLGELCPQAAHIRKMNPRDVKVRGVHAASNLLQAMLRRGIPYGPEIRDPFAPTARELAQKRGLIFAAYMSSILLQFEFVMHAWAHSPHLPEGGGRDPLLSFDPIRVPALPRGTIAVPPLNRWVTPTGGGYFFVPSIGAIRDVLSR